MTKLIVATTLIALSVITLSPVQAQDEPLVVEGRSAYQERVSFRDLDLREQPDRRILRERVAQAADRVCLAADGPHYRTNVTTFGTAGVPAGLNCADLTVLAARPQIRDAIAHARAGQPFTFAELVIASPTAL